MLRLWDLPIALDRAAVSSLHMQVVHAVIERIRAGLLAPGSSLPGSRQFAVRLGVNRKTVVLAYDELLAQGWVQTEKKRGTFVSDKLPLLTGEHVEAVLTGSISPASYCLNPPLMQVPSSLGQAVVEISDGAPDMRLISFEHISRACRHGLHALARGDRLGYADPCGLPYLRQLLSAQLRNERSLNTSEENICMVRGTQMGIYLIARILLRPGDMVAFEQLSYPPARAAFAACGAGLLGVAQDEFGMLPEALEALCQHQRLRAIYLTPHHQFPTTVTMPLERRLRLLALAELYDFVIVEDDYDHEFHFANRPMMPLASMDSKGRVIYVSSFSKSLAPGLRVGYIVSAPEVVKRIGEEIMLIDRQGNTLAEHVVADLISSGDLKRHIRRSLKVYAERQRKAYDCVQRHLKPWAETQLPDGGLALWVRLNERIDMAVLEKDALALSVAIVPASRFALDSQAPCAMRLGYASLTPAEFAKSVLHLQAAIEMQIRG